MKLYVHNVSPIFQVRKTDILAKLRISEAQNVYNFRHMSMLISMKFIAD